MAGNLWVSPQGQASCKRSATAIAYTRALKSGNVCDTFDGAYHAASSAGGDTVRVKNGSYAGPVYTADSSKNGRRTTFIPEKRYGVTLTSPTVFGPNVGFITIKDFVINSPKGGFLNSSSGLSTNITIDGNRINVGQKVDGTPAGIYFYSNIDGFRLINNTIGPSCCGTTKGSSPLGIRIGKANQGAPNANNVLINGNTIQYVLRSCSYWPATGYGPCPDTTCVVAGCHNDGIQIWGIQNSTISNNKLYNDEVQGLFIEDAAGAVNSNLTIVNNTVQVVGGGVAFNFKGMSGRWTIAFNSSPNVMVLGYGFRAAASGTTVALIANKVVLLMVDPKGRNAGCRDGDLGNVELSYSYNVWIPAGGATNALCSPTDVLTATPRYGGIGAAVSAFHARNPHGTTPPPAGAAYYKIDRTQRRRVVEFHIEVDRSAPYTDNDRLALLTRSQLPADAKVKRVKGNTCIVWQSLQLKKMIGMRYAVATTKPGSATAKLRAARRPQC